MWELWRGEEDEKSFTSRGKVLHTQTEEPFTKREEKGTELLDYDNC